MLLSPDSTSHHNPQEGGQHYKKTRARVKEIAQKALNHDITRLIERHEGIGGYHSWILPIMKRGTYASFIMLTDVKAVLQGTPAEWKKRKSGIYFTAKVQFCV